MSFGQLLKFALLSIGFIQPTKEVPTSECPIQCHCVPNRMSCEIPGLRRLPEPYMPQLESLLVENQTLDSTHLGPTELSVYRTPEFGGQVRLKSLYIRWCNVRTIGRHAFEALGSKLEILDLSGNPLTHIGDYAFAGLGPLTLVLDRIDQPKFDDHTFAGLTKMKSLLMRHSKLVSLPYQPLLSLVSEQRLDKLLLKGNRFHSLDSKFDRIFSGLHDFEINGNPWHCDCQLTWLIRRYRLMVNNRAQIHISRKRSWDDSNSINMWEQEDNQPKCSSPPGLSGRNFSDLITDVYDMHESRTNLMGITGWPTIIHCPPPQLERLDVDLGKYLALLQTENSNSLLNDVKQSAVNLKCVMRGSKQLVVEWRYHDPTTGPKIISEMNASLPSANEALGIQQRNRRLDDFVRTESSVKVFPVSQSDTYSCLGYDVLGNVSAKVRVLWPPTIPNVSTKMDISSTLATPNTTPEIANNFWSAEDIMSSQSVLHLPQFSLSQLLGAIGGTFFSTVMLFFLIHRCLHYYPAVCGVHKGRRRTKTKTRILESVIISPANTSSSNTSTSNTKLGSSPKTDEQYSSMPIFVSSEAMSLTANMLNAHAYHQLMNGGNNLVPGSTANVINPFIHPMESHAFRTAMQRGSSLHSASTSYEPVVYSDANNITYDVPSVLNRRDNDVLRPYPEQTLPLLFNSMLPSTNAPMDVQISRNPGLIQSALMIPPPPSIPQPSLPNNSNTANLNNAFNRAPSTVTNLLVLQASCNPVQSDIMTLNQRKGVDITACHTNFSR
ncbi:unnamed protein product [Dicrocoelium dendriticum]|nr:unnamed protein product [Dicrocoelium dendriticum]